MPFISIKEIRRVWELDLEIMKINLQKIFLSDIIQEILKITVSQIFTFSNFITLQADVGGPLMCRHENSLVISGILDKMKTKEECTGYSFDPTLFIDLHSGKIRLWMAAILNQEKTADKGRSVTSRASPKSSGQAICFIFCLMKTLIISQRKCFEVSQ